MRKTRIHPGQLGFCWPTGTPKPEPAPAFWPTFRAAISRAYRVINAAKDDPALPRTIRTHLHIKVRTLGRDIQSLPFGAKDDHPLTEQYRCVAQVYGKDLAHLAEFFSEMRPEDGRVIRIPLDAPQPSPTEVSATDTAPTQQNTTFREIHIPVSVIPETLRQEIRGAAAALVEASNAGMDRISTEIVHFPAPTNASNGIPRVALAS